MVQFGVTPPTLGETRCKIVPMASMSVVMVIQRNWPP